KITCIFEDNQQNIWIGSNGEGISILSPDFARFGVFLPQGPEGKNGVSSLSRSREGTIWAGIDQGLLQISAEGNPQFYNLPDELICHQPIGPVAGINETRVFLGTACGIKRWSPLHPTEVAEALPSPIPQNHLLSLHYIEPDLYIGTSLTDSLKGLWIYHTDDHSMSQYISSESPRGISGNHITKVLQSSSGQTWIGTWAELNLMKAENEFFHTDDFIQTTECLRGGNSTGSIMEDHLGNIWFGRIDEGGLLVINPQTGQFNCFDMESGLANLSVTAIMQDDRKDIWIGTYLGISRIRYPKDPFSSKELTIVHFKVKDGLPTNIITDGIAAKDGNTLYFGTGTGLIRLFPEKIRPDTIPPVIQFTDFKLFNSSVIPHPLSPVLKREIHEVDLISLNHRQNVFSIEFAGLNYFENEENIYAYRLQGVDPDWIETGKNHIITYSQLKPGRYLVEVKGKSSKSSWSKPVQLSVLIHPPFWQQWWFFVLVGIGITLAAYSFHAYRIRQIQRVQEIRNRIAADLHDDIGTTLSNIEILSFLGTQNPDNPEQEKGFFHKIRKEAKQSNEALHHIVWSINPENDYLNTVVSHLVRTALEILEPSGINVKVQRPELPESFKLISEKRKDLHLAFKEIITNISKYAQASTVDITFLLQKKELIICIRDNGIGLSDLAWEKGYGLKNIQKRMENWRGKAHFQNLPDQGLEITLRIPVP
ncbi:MAG: hypothetical protein KDD99_27605, partial [Bacteroidetes bacterium]|nr:hypothetical protein [Bacteroidota bacterium]